MDMPTITLLGFCVAVAVFGVGTGRLGLGIAVLAAPALSLILHHNMAVVLPLSLALNAATCVTAAVFFAPHNRSTWRHALDLTAITAVLSPFGAYASRSVPDYVIWYVYLGAMLFLVGHLLRPPRGHALPRVNWVILYLGAVPAGLVGGFTGIGPGFALMPGLVVAGMDPRQAAGTAALAGILPSLTALIPLWTGPTWDSASPIPMFVAAIVGTTVGAWFTLRFDVGLRWQRAFAGFIAVFALVHFFTIR